MLSFKNDNGDIKNNKLKIKKFKSNMLAKTFVSMFYKSGPWRKLLRTRGRLPSPCTLCQG